jgi:hypothetical protein
MKRIIVIVVDAAGHRPAEQRLELRRPGAEGPGRLVTMTSQNGEFAYDGSGLVAMKWNCTRTDIVSHRATRSS